MRADGLVVSTTPLLITFPTATGETVPVAAARATTYSPTVGDVVAWATTTSGVPFVVCAVTDFPTDDGSG